MSERYRLRFSKEGRLRYIGHLDLIRQFQRAIRRAELPAAYSQGFNPHMLLSFALPLPLGFESENDCAELTLETKIPPEALMERFNACCPDGLLLTGARPMPEDEPRAASLAAAADYRLYIPASQALSSAIAALLFESSLTILKKTKSGIQETDVRPDIFTLSLESVARPHILMRLSAGSQRFLHPHTAVSLIYERASAELPEYAREITRTQLYARDGGKLVPLYEGVVKP